MDSSIIALNIFQFGAIYLLLLLVLGIMKRAKVDQTKLLMTASIQMSIQLYIAGLILTYIFENPHPAFVIVYLLSMIVFSTARIMKRNKHLNPQFRKIIFFSIGGSGLFVLTFFILVVVGTDIFNPQYVIPIGGMIMGNAMNGLSLGIKTLSETMNLEKNKIETLINAGIKPMDILRPFINQSIATAMLPTLNNMLNMGIIALPGMMTGQMISGTVPLTAIMYQIAIMIAITTGVSLTNFFGLNFGSSTLINEDQQIEWDYQ